MSIQQNIAQQPQLGKVQTLKLKVAGKEFEIVDPDWMRKMTSAAQTSLDQLFNYITQSGVNRGPDLASGATITVYYALHRVTGSASISTISSIPTFAGGSVYLINGGSWQLVTGGNIATPYKPKANEIVQVVYDSTDQVWYVPGQVVTAGDLLLPSSLATLGSDVSIPIDGGFTTVLSVGITLPSTISISDVTVLANMGSSVSHSGGSTSDSLGVTWQVKRGSTVVRTSYQTVSQANNPTYNIDIPAIVAVDSAVPGGASYTYTFQMKADTLSGAGTWTLDVKTPGSLFVRL